MSSLKRYANWSSSSALCVTINCGIVKLIVHYSAATMRSSIIGEVNCGYVTYTADEFLIGSLLLTYVHKLLSVFSAIITTIASQDQAQQQRSNVVNNGAIHFPSEDLYNSVRRTAFSPNPLKQPLQISNTAIQFPTRQAPPTMQTLQTLNNPSMSPYQPMNAFQSQNNGAQSSPAGTFSSLQQNSDLIDFMWEVFQVSGWFIYKADF